MKKTILKKYARLIAECGANVQKGQDVFIGAGMDQPEFVKMVAEECYKLGAARVVVDFDYPPRTRPAHQGGSACDHDRQLLLLEPEEHLPRYRQ